MRKEEEECLDLKPIEEKVREAENGERK